MAAASGLGKLKVFEAAPELLALLLEVPAESRREVGLALARLLGAEVRYIQLSRALSADPGTALAQEMEALRTRRRKSFPQLQTVAGDLVAARDEFSAGNLDSASRSFLRAVDSLTANEVSPYCREILAECAGRMREFGSSRLEYALLACLVIERCGKAP